jgi:hypothetical protein
VVCGSLVNSYFRFTIFDFQGGSKRTRPSIIRANMRIWSKKVVFLTGLAGLSCYNKGS